MQIKTADNLCDVLFFGDVSSAVRALPLSLGKKVALLVSEKIDGAVIFRAARQIEECGAQAFVKTIADGERCKTVENATALALYLDENGFTRKDIIVNVGGGTVCDLGGFVASIYKRGVRFYNLPTTLLCAVDACIGGKTAVDAGGVKNLLGTFFQPSGAFVVKELIPQENFELINAGKSEIVKYALLDEEFFDYLQGLSGDLFDGVLFEVIEKCLNIKKKYVEADEHDEGARHALNLGHTVAHAIEAKNGYATCHADAVKTGLLAETELALKIGAINLERYKSICALYEKYFGLSHYNLKKLTALIPLAVHDKKNSDGKIKFILPSGSSVEEFGFTAEQLIKIAESAV